MFGSKKKLGETPAKQANLPGTHSLNTLVHGTVVEGAIKAENDIRVDGVIKGSLTCNAKVIIGPTGQIEGEVRCVNAVIEGSFDGTLTVAESLNVRETAKINGDVKTNKLIVQSGAVFNVACKMGNQAGSGSYSNSLKGTKTGDSAGKAQNAGTKKEAAV